MQNKPNCGNSKMNINIAISMYYVIFSYWLRRKNKPNSNPIKPITNPIKAKTKPIQTQTNPIAKSMSGTKLAYFHLPRKAL
jgi:hypothetical protein